MSVEILILRATNQPITAALPGFPWDSYAGITDDDWWIVEELDDPELEAKIIANNSRPIDNPYPEDVDDERSLYDG